ncbi:MAG: VanZ family protein [Desulfobacterales bacterium]|nr:VanZ family protein [Desulfobacterales bacterium]
MTQEKQLRLGAYGNKTILLLWLTILAVVVAGSLIPHAGPPDAGVGLDKALHGILYAILAGVAMGLFHDRKTALFLAVAVAPTGFLLEIAQAHIAGRAFSAGDLLANNVGVITGLGIGILWRLKRHYARLCTVDLSLGETLSDKAYEMRQDPPAPGALSQ